MDNFYFIFYVCLGVLNTILSFDDSVEELWDSEKLLYFVTVYYSKRLQIKISRGKRHLGWSTENSKESLWLSLLRGVTRTAAIWEHVGTLPNREAHWGLGVQGSVTYTCSVCRTNLSYSDSRWNWHSVAQSLRHTKPLSLGTILWRLRGHLPGAGASLGDGAMSGFEQPKPAKLALHCTMLSLFLVFCNNQILLLSSQTANNFYSAKDEMYQ